MQIREVGRWRLVSTLKEGELVDCAGKDLLIQQLRAKIPKSMTFVMKIRRVDS